MKIAGITVGTVRHRNTLSTVEEAPMFWMYGNGRPGSSCQPYGSTDPMWDSYSIFWDQEWHINTFAFNSNIFILCNEINYISTTVIINYVWFHPLCASDLLLNWFSGMNYCHCSFLFARKEEEWSICFSYVTSLKVGALVIVIYSYAICFLFSFMTFFNFRSL